MIVRTFRVGWLGFGMGMVLWCDRQTPCVGCVCASTNTCNFEPDASLQTPKPWLSKTTNRKGSLGKAHIHPTLNLFQVYRGDATHHYR